MLLTLHLDSRLRQIVFQISQRVIVTAFLAWGEPSAAPGLSLKSTTAASKAVLQTLSVKAVDRINLCKIHLPQMDVLPV